MLPYLLEKPEGASAEELLAISGYGGTITQFRGGLHRLTLREFLVVDKSKNPSIYRLSDTERAREHAHDPRKGFKEGLEKKKRIFAGYAQDVPERPTKTVKVAVTVRKVMQEASVPEPEKVKTPEVPIRTPVDPIECKIIAILKNEGAITCDEVYSLVKEHDYRYYQVVMGHITRLVNLKFAKLDTSIDPIMWYLSPAGEEHIQNYYPQHALEVEP